MKFRIIAAAGSAMALAGAALPTGAQAQANEEFSRFYVRASGARVLFDESAKVSIGGQPQPGADIKYSNNTTAVFELGYFLTRDISVEVIAAVPPKTTLTGAGTIAGLPAALGKVTYGAPAVVAIYNFPGLGPVRPFVGAGVAYAWVMKDKGILLENFQAKGKVGPTISGGAEFALNRKLGIHFVATKAFLNSNIRFNLPAQLGGAPGTVKQQLDPTILTAGLTVHF